ncbi:PREDICTED: B3 domain-containing transcription factor FUS3-like [Tarenaya hassleriana]|uniref:B3 domain-containing transcription factor FUS3-like n=1 Tax=Tarenaya hassleriana TaxID=28532 RepID=UPI00053C0EDC|nr:PREDICTED: B3 domain-containing transcription factor FUS3-like [Tarenaya hassleriana]
MTMDVEEAAGKTMAKACGPMAGGVEGVGSGGLSACVRNLQGAVNRKRRMPRLRRSSSSFSLLSALPLPSRVRIPPPPPARKIDRTRLRFLFEKELKNSDVSSLRRMILPKKAAEAHLPALEFKEGMFINMDDLDGLHVWCFKYRYWPNNNSRMYVLENTGDFVNAHGLHLGDYIMVYKDNQTHNYVIQARKASEREEEEDDDDVDVDVYTGLARIEENTVNNHGLCLGQDYEVVVDVGKSSCCRSYYPVMDSDHRDSGAAAMSFVYDTTKLSNDSPLDFLGGSMTNCTHSRFGSFEAFGSVDNLSLDDFY